jgi:tryptophanyl-tRNA synthetase
MSKRILLSGIKSTGRPHIGNYFGAMKQYVDLQDSHESYIFIADLHSLTGVQDAKELAQSTLDLFIDYLAVGLDPKKVTIFKQSDAPQVTELAWAFNCISTMPYLMRAHAFKDAEAKNKEINVGTFGYPLLMAADILIQDADVVPVGQDQKQHVEIARDTAEKFNRTFGDTFKLPEPLILESVKTVPGVDGQKMSKSYGNHIPLFASDEELKKLVMSIVTDSSGGEPKNVRAIHELFRDKAYLDTLYAEKAGKYKDLKEALLADLITFIAPLRERREAIIKDMDRVRSLLKEGGEKARVRAEAKMAEVRKKIGVSF